MLLLQALRQAGSAFAKICFFLHVHLARGFYELEHLKGLPCFFNYLAENVKLIKEAYGFAPPVSEHDDPEKAQLRHKQGIDELPEAL